MKIPFREILDAYESANFGEPGMTTAYVSRSTGKTFLVFEGGDNFDLPDDLEDSDDYLPLPDKRDLDLGQRLVWDFVATRLPEDQDYINGLFRSRGAYRRYKDFLDRKGLLDEWYEYERARTETALQKWCRLHQIEISDQNAACQPDE